MTALEILTTLEKAQEDVCSLNCPSTWRADKGQPPHSERCETLRKAIETLKTMLLANQ